MVAHRYTGPWDMFQQCLGGVGLRTILLDFVEHKAASWALPSAMLWLTRAAIDHTIEPQTATDPKTLYWSESHESTQAKIDYSIAQTLYCHGQLSGLDAAYTFFSEIISRTELWRNLRSNWLNTSPDEVAGGKPCG